MVNVSQKKEKNDGENKNDSIDSPRNRKKADMVAFATQNKKKLEKFNLIGTGARLLNL
ncbi:MAG: hypothetical protein ABDI07_01200 [Candidatus Kryptonium sp.]